MVKLIKTLHPPNTRSSCSIYFKMAKEEVTYTSPKRSSKISKDKGTPGASDVPSPISSSNVKPTSQASMASNNSSKSGGNSSSKSKKSSKSSNSNKSSKSKSSIKKDKSSKKDRSNKSSSASHKKPPKIPQSNSGGDRDTAVVAATTIPSTPKSKKLVQTMVTPKAGSASSLMSPRTPSSRSSRRRGGGRSRRSMKKGVRFNKTVGVNTIPNLDSFSQPELEAVWFAPDEYAKMEDDCDETASYMDARHHLVEDMCPRGLEAWTASGEQMKEWNVQEAIEKVWQAQLEQWQSSRDTAECWEYIRGEYIATSKRCSRDARTVAIKDEESVQTYLSTTRSVFQSYARRMYGTQRTSASKPIQRSNSEYTPRSSGSSSKKGIGRNRSGNFTSKSSINSSQSSLLYMGKNEKLKSSLKALSVYNSDSDGDNDSKKKKSPNPSSSINSSSNSLTARTSQRGSKRVSRKSRPNSSGNNNGDAQSIAASYASTVESSIASSRKIVFKPRSKVKIPTSPVGSVADGSLMDESTTSRRMRSHMSVASDDSTRRRMLRTTGMRPLG